MVITLAEPHDFPPGRGQARDESPWAAQWESGGQSPGARRLCSTIHRKATKHSGISAGPNGNAHRKARSSHHNSARGRSPYETARSPNRRVPRYDGGMGRSGKQPPRRGVAAVRSMFPWLHYERDVRNQAVEERMRQRAVRASSAPARVATEADLVRPTSENIETCAIVDHCFADGWAPPRQWHGHESSRSVHEHTGSYFRGGPRGNELIKESMSTSRGAHASLMDAAAPSIPMVDHYIRSDNLMYGAITKRGHTEAMPVSRRRDGLGLDGGLRVHAEALETARGEGDVDSTSLLFGHEDIDKLLKFFDSLGNKDGKVTLEEMMAGFRKIRRDWASVKAEEAGRNVLRKLVRLMNRASLSLEGWFDFMDTSRGGLGDGKLTVLELRLGFERLAAYIAAREGSCRAYKCTRVPNHGYPQEIDRDDSGVNTDDRLASSTQSVHSIRSEEAQAPCDADGSAGRKHVDGLENHEPHRGGLEEVASESGASVDAEESRRRHEDVRETLVEPSTHQASRHASRGKAVSCREHADEGMVYLGPRRDRLCFEDALFSPKDIGELVKFIDTNVNFELDIVEMRRAIRRLSTKQSEAVPTRKAAELLHVLEAHMHSTGSRFTDLFFCIDRNGNGYIERDEFRALFEQLAREPARQRAKVMAREEMARQREKRKKEVEEAARAAFARLEAYKKAGVYAVLKRIDVWQSRTGRRIADAYHGRGDRSGQSGLDADELVAFMANLHLDLSPTEAMLIIRHLDPSNAGRVEFRDITHALRWVRRDEMTVRTALRNVGPGWYPSLGKSEQRLVTASSLEANGIDDVRWLGRSWEHPVPETFSPPAKANFDGPVVFRPPVEALTHGRASTAPAQSRAGGLGHARLHNVRSFDACTTRRHPRQSGLLSDDNAPAIGGDPPTASKNSPGTAVIEVVDRGGGSSLFDNGRDASIQDAGGLRDTIHQGSSGNPRQALTIPGRSLQSIAKDRVVCLKTVREWWPAAVNAVEDGARLSIYTGSLLDGAWLRSLDSRLGSRMRGTRR